MKKILITLIALASILFTSCFDPIYGTIRTDVKPEKPTVNGSINSIARYNVSGKDYLVLAANGGLRYKLATDQSHGSWATYNGLPFSPIHTGYDTAPYAGKSIIKVTASNTHLYLATVEYDANSIPRSPEIWYAQITDWNSAADWKTLSIKTEGTKLTETNPLKLLIVSYVNDKPILAGFNLFGTNDFNNNENRSVYLRVGDLRTIVPKELTEDNAYLKDYAHPVYFKLNGGETELLSADVAKSTLANDKELMAKVDPEISGLNSAVVLDNKVHFLNSFVSTYYNNIFYTANGSKVYFGGKTDPTHPTTVYITNKDSPTDVGKDISSLAICSDALLVGLGNASIPTAGGITKINLNAEKALNGIGTPYGNATIQMPPSYIVQMLYNATPYLPESESTLYSAITFPGFSGSSSDRIANIGLWSYYPSRGNWNRE